MFPKRRITSVPNFKFLFQERTTVLVDTRKAKDYFSALKRLSNSIFMRIFYKQDSYFQNSFQKRMLPVKNQLSKKLRTLNYKNKFEFQNFTKSFISSSNLQRIQQNPVYFELLHSVVRFGSGGGGTPYNGLYGEVLPERGTFSRLQVMKGQGFYLLKYMKWQENLSFGP